MRVVVPLTEREEELLRKLMKKYLFQSPQDYFRFCLRVAFIFAKKEFLASVFGGKMGHLLRKREKERVGYFLQLYPNPKEYELLKSLSNHVDGGLKALVKYILFFPEVYKP